MVGRQAPLCRSRREVYFCLSRERSWRRELIQYKIGESEGAQIVLGFSRSEMERQDRRLRRQSRQHGGAFVAISLQPSRSRPLVRQTLLQRDGDHLFTRRAADDRLARRR